MTSEGMVALRPRASSLFGARRCRLERRREESPGLRRAGEGDGAGGVARAAVRSGRDEAGLAEGFEVAAEAAFGEAGDGTEAGEREGLGVGLEGEHRGDEPEQGQARGSGRVRDELGQDPLGRGAAGGGRRARRAHRSPRREREARVEQGRGEALGQRVAGEGGARGGRVALQEEQQEERGRWQAQAAGHGRRRARRDSLRLSAQASAQAAAKQATWYQATAYAILTSQVTSDLRHPIGLTER